MKVLRIYHGGRDSAHRERDRALVRAGAELVLVVPQAWTDVDSLATEPFQVVQLPVTRLGDVNRHRYAKPDDVAELLTAFAPDVVDLHEEPFSSVVHQLLRIMPRDQAVVAYTAQNIDKRFPPPFAQYERAALARLDGMYPCSAQAASVVTGKGFRGAVSVLPLAPAAAFGPGEQEPSGDHFDLLLVGRLVPEKGVLDAVRVLAGLGPGASLTLIGDGPESAPAAELAALLGVADVLRVEPWMGDASLAAHYQRAHVLLVPSTATQTWVEQFGRVVVEAHAAGAVVVAYASGALPEVVGDAGVLVAEGDCDALTMAVRELHDDSERWRRLRDAGFDAAVTWDDIARGQLELYERAADGAVLRDGVRRRPPVRQDRAGAVDLHGPPARLDGTARPFALPLLRNNTAVARTMGVALDHVARRATKPSPHPIRVVYVDHVARMSGGEIALARLISALPEVDAYVILGEDGPLRGELERSGASVEILPLDPRARDTARDAVVGSDSVRSAAAFAAYIARLTGRLRSLRPDLVHTNSLKSGFYGCTAAQLAGVPAIWHLRDRLTDDYLPAPTITATRAALRRLPRAVLCPSVEVSSHVGGPSAVIADPFAPRRSPASVRDVMSTIGIVGRISPWKGQDVVLRALAQVPGLELQIIGSPMFGEDAYLDELRALAAELGVDDRVRFVGFAENVEDRLAELDALVHASTLPEPFGQVIVEGLAAGLPVIASDGGGPSEILTDGVNGLLVKPGDADALAAALRRLGDVAERRRLNANGLQRARAYTPTPIGGQMRALYREVLGSGSVRRAT